MADPARFGHDQLGHLLADRLLRVPRFQRQYAWDETNVNEFLDDLAKARSDNTPYFMGTVVLADEAEKSERQLIIDGQQRLATTAVLMIAVRDRLRELDQHKAADGIDQQFLRRYEISQEQTVTRLILSAKDTPTYDNLLDGKYDASSSALLSKAFAKCKEHATDVAPTAADYKALIAMVTYLQERVQVLLAMASGIPEAYVIFETLNDRGADLTTADLLKNYLFSQAGDAAIDFVEAAWTKISSAFDKPEDLVKFIRYEYSSRSGKVTNRQLYKALQTSIGGDATSVKAYLSKLEAALGIFLALRDPDHSRWSTLDYDVRVPLLAFRRFGFESSIPLLLAVFHDWGDGQAGRVIGLVTSWSVRALMAGKLGGGSAEAVFCEAAVSVAKGVAKNQPDLRKAVDSWVPDDQEFRQSFLGFGSLTTTRAKYLLGMLERQNAAKNGLSIEGLPDWSSKSVTIEHILPQSSKAMDFPSSKEFEEFEVICDQIQNLTLLERSLNKDAGDKPFGTKAAAYGKSAFGLTKALATHAVWTIADADRRSKELADLAVAAWPK